MELIPFSKSHFDELSTWFPDDKAVKLWAGPEYNFPVFESDIQRMLDEPSSERPSRFAWTAKVKGAVIGHSQLNYDWANGSALLCRVAISPSKRELGFSKPMLIRTLKNAFDNRNIHEVRLNVFTFNEAAIAVYSSLKFTNMGILKPPVKFGTDRWDTYTMRLSRSEWAKTQQSI